MTKAASDPRVLMRKTVQEVLEISPDVPLLDFGFTSFSAVRSARRVSQSLGKSLFLASQSCHELLVFAPTLRQIEGHILGNDVPEVPAPGRVRKRRLPTGHILMQMKSVTCKFPGGT